MEIRQIYDVLIDMYGPRGWWPIVDPDTLICEYGIGAPRDKNDVYEISIGAILTQYMVSC